MALKLDRQIKVYMLIVSLCSGTWTLAATPPNSTFAEFEQWMARHGRNYADNHEKAKRYGIFPENLRFIEGFNDKAANRSYKVGLNQFSDLTTDEFVARYTGFRAPSKSSSSPVTTTFKYQNVTRVPDSVNWVDQGLVGSVKSQGPCGSCWAFSATAAVESIRAISTSVLVDLSEQQLVDCIGRSQGCTGGWMDIAFEYIVQHKGISYENVYPYVGSEGTCNARLASIAGARISGYEYVPVSEDELLKAVAMQPVSTSIDASSPGFRGYAGGIFDGPCGTELNHAVVIVRYGTTADGVDYWLIKNSWDVTWGERGYMRIRRNSGIQGGLCALALRALYPLAID